MIKIEFPDGAIKEFEKGISGLEIAQSISPSLAKASLFIKFNDEVIDLTKPLNIDGKLAILTDKNKEEVLPYVRHSCAHIMAQAVLELYPEAKLTIGPSIDYGFYYDFDKEPFSENDFAKIEKKMAEIIDRNIPVESGQWSKEEAIAHYKKEGNEYKLELIEDIPTDEKISYYKQGDFLDLCRGPHISSTGKMPKAFKIMKVAGAYWRGNSDNKMLQRIYAVSFMKKKDLDAHLVMLEEAEKRDHRKLAKQMDLLHFEPEFAPGAVFWHNDGYAIYRTLIEFMREKQEEAGYIEVETPRLMDRVLWETSGHWEKYGEHNYSGSTEDGREFCLKPMNCPGGVLVFKQGIKSHKDLPIKMAEFGKVNRYEASGALHGLLRVREFTQDDAHIFCTPEQMENESIKVVKFILDIYKGFGFDDVVIKLSTRPDNRIGSDEIWDITEKALADALENNGYEYTIFEGEGAFYGPKLEFVLRDAIGREWQMGTLQVDMNLPERFDISYIGEDSEKHRPVMLHRAILGSIERFMGMMIEHYAGKLPLWIAPKQAIIIPISDKYNEYANSVMEDILSNHVDNVNGKLRIDIDHRAESMQKRIRDAQLAKIPYIIIVGEKEQDEKSISVRLLDGKQFQNVKLDNFIKLISEEISKRNDFDIDEKSNYIK